MKLCLFAHRMGVLLLLVSASCFASTSTTTTITASSATGNLSTVLTFTAAVSPAAATGTVSFYDATGGTTLGTKTLGSGKATLSTTFPSIGTHVITAIYKGSTSYTKSTSATTSVVITSATTAVAFSVSPASIPKGGGVALIAVVTPLNSTGTVTFYDKTTSTTLGTATLSAQSVAALTTTKLAVGTHSIVAKYNSLTSKAATVTVKSATAGALKTDQSCGYTQDGATGAYVLSSGALTATSGAYSTSTADQSAVCMTGASTSLTLLNPTVSSTAATSNDGDSSWYGLDAAVLDYNGGNLTLDGAKITSAGNGANMVYAYGSGLVTISNSTLSSPSSNHNNHGIYASGSSSAKIVANNVTATSTGDTSSIVATDNGGGTLTLNGGSYKAKGGKSAGIYSTGSITANNAVFTSTTAEAAVIEGSNVIYLNNATLNSASSGTHRGILLYQSMSGDAKNNDCGDKGDCFQMTGGSINYTDTTTGSSDPSSNCTLFEVFDQTSWVTLTDVAINSSCPTLLLSSYNDQWANSFSYSSTQGIGKAHFYAYGTTLTGNIVTGYGCTTTACTARDTASTAAIYLYKDSSGVGSKLTGAINTHNTGGGTTLALDAKSKWIVTGTSYLKTLTDADTTYSNITCQTTGCKVYVNGKAISIK
jgi:hypothetical protein